MNLATAYRKIPVPLSSITTAMRRGTVVMPAPVIARSLPPSLTTKSSAARSVTGTPDLSRTLTYTVRVRPSRTSGCWGTPRAANTVTDRRAPETTNAVNRPIFPPTCARFAPLILPLRGGEALAVLVDGKWWRFVGHEIFELSAEFLFAQLGGGTQTCHFLRIVKVIAPQTDHVAACDRVARRGDIHHPHFRAARLSVDHLGKRNRYEVAALHGDHRGVAAGHEVLRRAIAEVARVLHIERDRIGAAQLVTDVLLGNRRRDPERTQPLGDFGLQNVAQVHFGETHVPVGVALHVFEIREIAFGNVERHPFCDHRHAVAAAFSQPLDDARGQRVDDLFESNRRREFLSDQRNRCPRRFADA